MHARFFSENVRARKLAQPNKPKIGWKTKHAHAGEPLKLEAVGSARREGVQLGPNGPALGVGAKWADSGLVAFSLVQIS